MSIRFMALPSLAGSSTQAAYHPPPCRELREGGRRHSSEVKTMRVMTYLPALAALSAPRKALVALGTLSLVFALLVGGYARDRRGTALRSDAGAGVMTAQVNESRSDGALAAGDS